MALFTDCELYYIRCNPKFPSDTYNKENPVWEVQIRSTSKEVKRAWADAGLRVKTVVPEDDSPPYFSAQLRKRSLKNDKSPAKPPRFINGEMAAIDPDTVANGSVGNIETYARDFVSENGLKGTTHVLMAVQVTKHVWREKRERVDPFKRTATTLIKPDKPADEQDESDDAPY